MNVIVLNTPKKREPQRGVTLFMHAGGTTFIARLNPGRRRKDMPAGNTRQTSRTQI